MLDAEGRGFGNDRTGPATPGIGSRLLRSGTLRCCPDKKFQHMCNACISPAFQSFLNSPEQGADFGCQFRIKRDDLVRLFIDDVVESLSLICQTIKARAIVEETALYQADFFKCTQTAINSDKVTRMAIELFEDVFDTDRSFVLSENIDDGDAWLGNPETGFPESLACRFQTLFRTCRGRSIGHVCQWMVSLCGCDHVGRVNTLPQP